MTYPALIRGDEGLRAETEPTSELAEEISRWLLRILVLRHHAAQHQRGLEQRERIGRIGVGQHIADRGRLQSGFDVPAVQHQPRLGQALRLGKDWVTTAQRDRGVKHCTAALDAVGRRIGSTHRRSRCGQPREHGSVEG